jgi:hypothetical protein
VLNLAFLHDKNEKLIYSWTFWGQQKRQRPVPTLQLGYINSSRGNMSNICFQRENNKNSSKWSRKMVFYRFSNSIQRLNGNKTVSSPGSFKYICVWWHLKWNWQQSVMSVYGEFDVFFSQARDQSLRRGLLGNRCGVMCLLCTALAQIRHSQIEFL